MILQDWDVVNKCAMCCKMNVLAVTAYFEVHHVAVYCGLGSINYLVEIVDIFICICLYFWLTSSYASHQLPLLIMVALWNRADIVVLWFLSFFFYLSFFLSSPNSAAADWMSTILRHMIWPLCDFRMQVWNVLQAARWKYRTQKWCKKLPFEHHCTTLSGYIFGTKACIDNRKKTC